MGLHCQCAAQTVPRCAQLIDSNEWNVIFRMVDRKKVRSGRPAHYVRGKKVLKLTLCAGEGWLVLQGRRRAAAAGQPPYAAPSPTYSSSRLGPFPLNLIVVPSPPSEGPVLTLVQAPHAACARCSVRCPGPPHPNLQRHARSARAVPAAPEPLPARSCGGCDRRLGAPSRHLRLGRAAAPAPR